MMNRLHSFDLTSPGRPAQAPRGWLRRMETDDRAPHGPVPDHLSAQARQRRINDRAIVENPLGQQSSSRGRSRDICLKFCRQDN